MTLDESDRNFVTINIDTGLKHVPETIRFARDPNIIKKLMLNNDYDYVIGNLLGKIMAHFTSFYVARHHQTVPLNDLEEATNMILDRIPEMRNAILDQG